MQLNPGIDWSLNDHNNPRDSIIGTQLQFQNGKNFSYFMIKENSAQEPKGHWYHLAIAFISNKDIDFYIHTHKYTRIQIGKLNKFITQQNI